jgi:hypothetical protein
VEKIKSLFFQINCSKLLQLVVCEKSLRAPTFEKKSLQEKERKKSVCWLKGAKKKKEGVDRIRNSESIKYI